MKKENNELQVERSFLMTLFETSLKDIYWAERALTGIFPRMIKDATSKDLKEALSTHLEETVAHVERIETVFELLHKKASAKKCAAMEGLMKECDELMLEMEEGPQRDAAILFCAQKMEHYEIASYGTLATFANTMGLEDVAVILKSILGEEKNADHVLTHIAVSSINIDALQTEEQEPAE